MKKSFKGITIDIRKALFNSGQAEEPDKETLRCRKYNLTKDEYEKQRYDLLSDKQMYFLMTKPKISGKIDYVADKYGAPRGEVYAKEQAIKNEYGIPLDTFVRENLFAVDSYEELKEARAGLDKKNDNNLNTLAEITGMDSSEAEKYAADIKAKFGKGVSFILRNELFKLNDAEIAELLEKREKEADIRKERIKQANNWTDFDFERSRALCRFRYRISELNEYDNLRCWAYPVEVLDTFAVRQDCLDMRETYNKMPVSMLANKIEFNAVFKEFLGRKYWINRDTSFEEFMEFVGDQKELFCKPFNLTGGHGCYRYQVSDDIEEMYQHFINEPKMLVEEIPKQHHLISEIYDKSINTIRIMAAIKDDEFVPFAAWIKFGAKGSIVDGRVGGGCFAGVNVKTGIVDTPAIDYDNNRFEKHIDTGKQITGFQVPCWNEVLDLAERALRHVDGIDFVGWDICVTEDGPLIIEGNSAPFFTDVQLLYNYKGHEGEGQRWRYVDLLEDPDKWRRV
jgi:hypothetical protein